MKNLRVVEEFDTMDYSLYMGDKKVRTVTQEELADAERKMVMSRIDGRGLTDAERRALAITRLIDKADKYWGKSVFARVRAFSDIKHPGRTRPIEQLYTKDKGILDSSLFKWEEE